MRSSTLLFCLTSAVFASSQAASLPSCDSNVKIPISAHADNVDLPSSLDLSTLTADGLQELARSPRRSIFGDYDIAATYCQPKTKTKHSDTLQILVHGVTYTRDYWSGLGRFNGTAYSWVDYAAQQGYATLAIDRICNGASSKLDGVLACQLPLNVETLKGVVDAARAGRIGGRSFSKVVLVTHSEGSVIANLFQQVHPDVVDTFVMTGFTDHLLVGAPGSFAAGVFAPAALADPKRYATLIDPAYLLATSKRGATGIFYYGDYTQAMADHDFATRGSIPVGEFATAPLGQLPAPDFHGAVLLLNGAQDEIFCARLPTDPVLGFRGDCGSGDSSLTERAKGLYPHALVVEARQVDRAGHDLTLHYNAQESFQIAHDFLEAQGY